MRVDSLLWWLVRPKKRRIVCEILFEAKGKEDFTQTAQHVFFNTRAISVSSVLIRAQLLLIIPCNFACGQRLNERKGGVPVHRRSGISKGNV